MMEMNFVIKRTSHPTSLQMLWTFLINLPLNILLNVNGENGIGIQAYFILHDVYEDFGEELNWTCNFCDD